MDENSYINDIEIGDFIFDVFISETGDLGFTVTKKDCPRGEDGELEGAFVDIFVSKDDIHDVTFG